MTRFVRPLSGATMLFLAVLATSCSGVREERLPETGATLEGVVKFGGEELQFAMIMVQAGNTAANGKIHEDGRYKVENVPLGEVKIGVNTSAARGDYTSKMMAGGANQGPESQKKGKVIGVKFIDVPAKYFDPETSGITTTVQKGINKFDIVIPK